MFAHYFSSEHFSYQVLFLIQIADITNFPYISTYNTQMKLYCHYPSNILYLEKFRFYLQR